MSTHDWEQPASRRVALLLIVLALIAVGPRLVAAMIDGEDEDDRLSVDAEDDEPEEPGTVPLGAEGDEAAEVEWLEPRDSRRLPGVTGMELFAQSSSGLVRIDLETGAALRRGLAQVPDEPSMTVVGGVVVTHRENEVLGLGADLAGDRHRISDEDQAVRAAPWGQVLPAADGEHVWVVTDTSRDSELRKAHVDGSGTVARHSFPGAELLGADPTGLVLHQYGHAIVHDPETGEGRTVASSQFAAYANGQVMWVDCDGSLTCALVTSGLDGRELGRAALPDEGQVEWEQTYVSPDGRRAYVTQSPLERPPAARQWLVDTEDGTVWEARLDASEALAVAWAPDGSWMFVVTRDNPDAISALRGADNETVLLNPDLPGITALAVR